MNQMPGNMGTSSTDQSGLHSDSSLPSTLHKWVICLYLLHQTILSKKKNNLPFLLFQNIVPQFPVSVLQSTDDRWVSIRRHRKPAHCYPSVCYGGKEGLAWTRHSGPAHPPGAQTVSTLRVWVFGGVLWWHKMQNGITVPFCLFQSTSHIPYPRSRCTKRQANG